MGLSSPRAVQDHAHTTLQCSGAPDLIKSRPMEDSRASVPRADTRGVRCQALGPRHLLGGWSSILTERDKQLDLFRCLEASWGSG